MSEAAFGDLRVAERYWLKMVVTEGGCWEWTACHNELGYGKCGATVNGVRRTWKAHRYIYTMLVGDVSPDLVLDHLCRVTSCCNPVHLEPVTQRMNLLRGNTVTAAHAAKTHCPADHEYSPENTVMSEGSRCCRECLRLRSADYRLRNKERLAQLRREKWAARRAKKLDND